LLLAELPRRVTQRRDGGPVRITRAKSCSVCFCTLPYIRRVPGPISWSARPVDLARLRVGCTRELSSDLLCLASARGRAARRQPLAALRRGRPSVACAQAQRTWVGCNPTAFRVDLADSLGAGPTLRDRGQRPFAGDRQSPPMASARRLMTDVRWATIGTAGPKIGARLRPSACS
jgi:hypothetical protein